MAASEQSILSLVRGLSFPRKRESRPDLIGDLDCVASAQNRAWHVLRLALGALLLTAVVLKTHALATQPAVGTGLLASPWFVLAVVQVELLVGFWLIAGIWRVWAWRSSVALFAVFGVISLSKALGGEASCGCFGRLTVSPWLTTGLNAAAAFALVGWCAPPRKKRRVMSRAAAALVCVWVLTGASVAVLASVSRPAVLDESGEITGSGGAVVLEPDTWVGKPLPLLAHIDIGPELQQGEWITVLYRRHCADCQALLECLATDVGAPHEAGVRLAVVEVPMHRDGSEVPIHLPARAVVGRLDKARTWHVSTPTILRVSDGRVVGVDAAKELLTGY